MRGITFFSKARRPENSVFAPAQLMVHDAPADKLSLSINGQGVELNAVQVDKLRQVFHGWLHERASGADGMNWIEEKLSPVNFGNVPVRQ